MDNAIFLFYQVTPSIFTILSRVIKVVLMPHITGKRYIRIVIISSINDMDIGLQGLSRLRGNSHGLVLRGGGGSNAASLPDFIEG